MSQFYPQKDPEYIFDRLCGAEEDRLGKLAPRPGRTTHPPRRREGSSDASFVQKLLLRRSEQTAERLEARLS